MILRVDPANPTPAYEQIREQISTMATLGTLPAGTRLPTIRQLALDLGLAKGTVAKAYEELDREEVIATRGRAGSFVRFPTRPARDLAESRLASAAEVFAVAAFQVGADQAAAVAALDGAWAVIASSQNGGFDQRGTGAASGGQAG
jgi:GntR family transcriptional regulator